MYKHGYEDICVVTDSEGIGLTIGSCLFLYTKKGENIREYITIPDQLPKGEAITEINDEIHENELSVANDILENRRNYRCCMSLFTKSEKV